MNRYASIVALAAALLAAGPAPGGEPACGPTGHGGVWGRWHPAGGWHPDGGGLLHWWPRPCFPRCGGPDDYCRKPPPNVCWPPYPPYYVFVPSGCCAPDQGHPVIHHLPHAAPPDTLPQLQPPGAEGTPAKSSSTK